MRITNHLMALLPNMLSMNWTQNTILVKLQKKKKKKEKKQKPIKVVFQGFLRNVLK